MDLLTMLRVLVRRWYVTVPCLLVTAVACLSASRVMQPEYQATGSVILLSPPGVNDVGANPYLAFDSGLYVTADVIRGIALTDPAFATNVVRAGGTDDYAVDVSPGSPTLVIAGTGPSPESAITTVRTVVEGVQSTLEELQGDVDAPSHLRIRSAIINDPTSTTTLHGTLYRAIAGILAASAVVTLTLVFAVESIARGRRSRRPTDRPGRAPAGQGRAATRHGVWTGRAASTDVSPASEQDEHDDAGWQPDVPLVFRTDPADVSRSQQDPVPADRR